MHWRPSKASFIFAGGGTGKRSLLLFTNTIQKETHGPRARPCRPREPSLALRRLVAIFLWWGDTMGSAPWQSTKYIYLSEMMESKSPGLKVSRSPRVDMQWVWPALLTSYT